MTKTEQIVIQTAGNRGHRVLRDSKGYRLIGFLIRLKFLMQAKLHAIINGKKLAFDRDHRKLHVELNS